MNVSKEFEMGINLIKRFLEQLKEILNISDERELKKIIEAVKHPITAAAYQIKAGEGPLKEELVTNLSIIVREFRTLKNADELKNSISELLRTVNSVDEATKKGEEEK